MDRKNEIDRMADGAAKDDAMRVFRAGLGSARRLFAGNTAERTATIVSAGAQGRPRQRLTVTAAGDPSIEVLDAAGATIDRYRGRSRNRAAESLCYDFEVPASPQPLRATGP
jgi:hypothetical protein